MTAHSCIGAGRQDTPSCNFRCPPGCSCHQLINLLLLLLLLLCQVLIKGVLLVTAKGSPARS
jgi:hypothetical protein